MNIGLSTAWAFVKTFWPFAIIIALAFLVLMQKNQISERDNTLNAVQAELVSAKAVNAHNVKTLDELVAARTANDNIILDLLEKQRTSGALETQRVETIKEVIRNDPQTRDWADTPIPDGVRDNLNAKR